MESIITERSRVLLDEVKIGKLIAKLTGRPEETLVPEEVVEEDRVTLTYVLGVHGAPQGGLPSREVLRATVNPESWTVTVEGARKNFIYNDVEIGYDPEKVAQTAQAAIEAPLVEPFVSEY